MLKALLWEIIFVIELHKYILKVESREHLVVLFWTYGSEETNLQIEMP